MDGLSGKRLLILGGSLWKDAIKQYADDNGIILIATGNNAQAGIFDIAEEKYNVNSIDHEAMKNLICEKKIDGVYLGGAEIVISEACEYLAELNMPCYCTRPQWDLLQNKKNFKELCVKNDLPVVPRYDISENDLKLPAEMYPVITKPADGCGSSGFSICNNDIELKQGYNKAAENSRTKNVIVEKFVRNEGNVVFYTVSNGKIYFSGLSDKYPVQYKKQGSYVGGLFVYESRYEEEFRKKFENKIQKMISSIGIKEGTFWIEVFHDKGEYYFNEVGYRYGGSASIYPTDYLFGINQVASDIYYALTGKSKIFGHPSMFGKETPKKSHYAVYPVHILPGCISEINGLDIIEKCNNVVRILTTKTIGNVINDSGSFDQTFALVHIVFDDKDELIDTLNYIHQHLTIRDKNGNQMVNRMLDVAKNNIII